MMGIETTVVGAFVQRASRTLQTQGDPLPPENEQCEKSR